VPNALAQETSPYLLQHRDNPVDWLPWGEEAFARARERDVPVLVSIGYSSCHWCHVMERESFEDEATAQLMNERFVCVKVDREERPDVDAVHMEAVQAMTGHGGWPLNCFVTPDGMPFFGGTYFPPGQRQGMPSWTAVLQAVGDAWQARREEILAQGTQMAARLGGAARLQARPDALGPEILDEAIETLSGQFDSVNGGWGPPAPKFPAASTMELLLRRGETRSVVYTLRSMASGGIFDQVGGGFARYSTDETWTVPHFEKMLYDNALLARALLHAFQTTGDPELRRVCEETLDWCLRDMRAPEGGFYSALDADSEGEEGKFYVWTLAELREALGDDADAAIRWLGATERGNFVDPHHPRPAGAPGLNVLEDRGPRPDDATRARIRARLLEVRERRVPPGLDDKRLTAWNALLIAALADAGAVLGREDHLAAARDAAVFCCEHLREDGGRGRLLRTSDGRQAKIRAYLEDHAFLLEALLVLFEATGEARWFVEARRLGDELLEHFADPERGGFFSTADDGDRLVARRKELEDAPIPAGGSSAALGLLRLFALTGEHRYAEAAEGQLRLVGNIAARHPGAFAHLLQALDLHLGAIREVAIVGPEAERAALVAVVRERLRADVVLATGPGAAQDPDPAVPLLAGRDLVDGRAAAYVCEHFACRRPVTEPDELRALLA
jgi:uncharacterized protein YyaL (SSP411 family)